MVGSNLLVAQFKNNSVLTFPLTASGNVAPAATLAGGNTNLSAPRGIALNGSEFFVSNFGDNSIRVYSGTSGNLNPIRTIIGANTGLSLPDNLAVYQGLIFCASFNNSVRIFNLNDDGNVFPFRVIEGGSTQLNGTVGLTLFPE